LTYFCRRERHFRTSDGAPSESAGRAAYIANMPVGTRNSAVIGVPGSHFSNRPDHRDGNRHRSIKFAATASSSCRNAGCFNWLI
jgi:hypothetical protein